MFGGENFPYTNFHDLNMDWIIKIAKEFLDQYTHLQETLDNGLTELDEKAAELEAQLQAWYDTHSNDIAQQLATSLAQIESTLNTSIIEFNSLAEAEGRRVLATIPSDYSTLSSGVTDLQSTVKDGGIYLSPFIQGTRDASTGILAPDWTNRCTTQRTMVLNTGDSITISNIPAGVKFAVAGYLNGVNKYDSGWQTADFSYRVSGANSGATYFVNAAKTDGTSDISASELANTRVITKQNRLYVSYSRIDGTFDVNKIFSPGSYRIDAYGNNWKPANYPLDGGGNLLVIPGNYTETDRYYGICQILYAGNRTLMRFGDTTGGWTGWSYYLADGTASDIVALNGEIETAMKLQQLSTCRTISSTLPTQPLTLLHFSDIHGNERALKRVIEFKNYYSQYLDDAIHTGDTLRADISDVNVFPNVSGAETVLNAIGNHDTWDYQTNNWYALSEADSRAEFITPFLSNWGSVSIPTDKCYYYKDYPAKNATLIVLDNMHYNPAQLTWFTNALETARTNGRHVIVANHVIMGRLQDMTWLTESGFDNPMYPRNTTPDYGFPMYVPNDYVTAVDNFVNAGGIIAVWLAGHMHSDALGTYHNILNIAVTTEGDYSDIGRTTDMRIAGTKSEDAFNVVGINTAYGQIYVMRIGMDYNAVLKKVDTLCWDYFNHRMIYTS